MTLNYGNYGIFLLMGNAGFINRCTLRRLAKLCWSLQGAVLYEDRKYSLRPKKFKLSNTEPIYKGKKFKVPLLTI